jgi:hypothetical protein
MQIQLIYRYIVLFSLACVFLLSCACTVGLNATPSSQEPGQPSLDKTPETADLNSDDDGDGLTLRMEIEFYTDPSVPNPNVNYALDNGLKSYVDRIKQFDEDGTQDADERCILDESREIFFSLLPLEEKELLIDGLLSGPHSDFVMLYNQLAGISKKAAYRTLGSGLDDTIVDYISYVNSLADEELCRYAFENRVCIQDHTLTELEKDYLKNPEGQCLQRLFDTYLSEIGKADPDLAVELLKLPDLTEIDMRDVEALEDILGIAGEGPVFEEAIDALLDEGIEAKRKYCSSLEALLWIAYDDEIDRWSSAKDFSVESVVVRAWNESTASNNYQSKRWSEFDTVVDRLNSPKLISIYMVDNISYDFNKMGAFEKSGSDVWQTPVQTFRKKSGICKDQARFALYNLLENGYEFDDFDRYRDDSACILFACARNWTPGKGHLVCLYIDEGDFFTIDNGRLKGPFTTIAEAADATYRDWGVYKLVDVNCTVTKTAGK